jgi:hypothetical protein
MSESSSSAAIVGRIDKTAAIIAGTILPRIEPASSGPHVGCGQSAAERRSQQSCGM